jgi:hypothetical protein
MDLRWICGIFLATWPESVRRRVLAVFSHYVLDLFVQGATDPTPTNGFFQWQQ